MYAVRSQGHLEPAAHGQGDVATADAIVPERPAHIGGRRTVTAAQPHHGRGCVTQKLYNNFIDQLGDEKTDILKCVNFRKDKENFVNKINSCNKMIDDENNLADSYKMELDKREAETEELKRKEADAQALVAKYKL